MVNITAVHYNKNTIFKLTYVTVWLFYFLHLSFITVQRVVLKKIYTDLTE